MKQTNFTKQTIYVCLSFAIALLIASCKKTYEPSPDKAVDLGLSVKWAAVNLGAYNPEDYGDYYAWGEISPKNDFSWNTYKYSFRNAAASPGKDSIYIEHVYKDIEGKDSIVNCSILYGDSICGMAKYDAATAAWGSDWRLPTMREIKELTDSCSCTWTWEKDYKGKRGFLVTSKINGKSIFIPAAGTMLNKSNQLKDDYVSFWSGTYEGVDDDANNALAVAIDGPKSSPKLKDMIISYGRSIRPVCTK